MTVAKSYSDYIKTGQLDQLTAINYNTVRAQARQTVAKSLAEMVKMDLPADADAFGVLDTVAVRLVEWYGPAQAGEVFRHYAAVCERQCGEGEGSANG